MESDNYHRGSTPHPSTDQFKQIMKATEKRLAYVLMSTNGMVSDDALNKARRFINLKHGMDTQTVSTLEEGFSTTLIFEIYNESACLKDRIGYRLRKLFTTARMKLNGNKIVVTVVIEGDTDRFPMHGAFH